MRGRPCWFAEHPTIDCDLSPTVISATYAEWSWRVCSRGWIGRLDRRDLCCLPARVVSARRLWLLPLRSRSVDTGLRVLLVSTDPASNLRDVFELATKEEPVAVGAVQGLDVMDIDPQTAAAEYRSRVIDPYRGVLPDAEITALEEKLAGVCTVEVAAFDAFARLFAEPALISTYDHVVFDTAPTGHTLRLLSLPAGGRTTSVRNPDATSCLGPLGGVQDHRPVYASAVRTLQDGAETSVVLVARPDPGALAVAATAAAELHDLGIDHQALIVNGVLTHPLVGDPVAGIRWPSSTGHSKRSHRHSTVCPRQWSRSSRSRWSVSGRYAASPRAPPPNRRPSPQVRLLYPLGVQVSVIWSISSTCPTTA